MELRAGRRDPAGAVGVSVRARRARRRAASQRAQQACFWAGWTVLALALVSPLHPLGEVLFSAHMAQHEILMLVAAPLLVLSRPLVAFLWGMPFGWRRELRAMVETRGRAAGWSALTAPLTAWWCTPSRCGPGTRRRCFRQPSAMSGSTARSTSASSARRCCSGGRCSSRSDECLRPGVVLHLHDGDPYRQFSARC